tara:strand:- start:2375 stop:2752 length:378 start_codon:yes stop_codon:yes gene_type:complete
MAFFGVTKEKINLLYNHPGADRLDLAKLDGMSFQFVVGRDTFKLGDEVIYFPVDSLIPEDVLARIGLVGKLAGRNKNRVKTIRLCGEISQGIVATFDQLAGLVDPSMDTETLTKRSKTPRKRGFY